MENSSSSIDLPGSSVYCVVLPGECQFHVEQPNTTYRQGERATHVQYQGRERRGGSTLLTSKRQAAVMYACVARGQRACRPRRRCERRDVVEMTGRGGLSLAGRGAGGVTGSPISHSATREVVMVGSSGCGRDAVSGERMRVHTTYSPWHGRLWVGWWLTASGAGGDGGHELVSAVGGSALVMNSPREGGRARSESGARRRTAVLGKRMQIGGCEGEGVGVTTIGRGRGRREGAGVGMVLTYYQNDAFDCVWGGEAGRLEAGCVYRVRILGGRCHQKPNTTLSLNHHNLASTFNTNLASHAPQPKPPLTVHRPVASVLAGTQPCSSLAHQPSLNKYPLFGHTHPSVRCRPDAAAPHSPMSSLGPRPHFWFFRVSTESTPHPRASTRTRPPSPAHVVGPYWPDCRFQRAYIPASRCLLIVGSSIELRKVTNVRFADGVLGAENFIVDGKVKILRGTKASAAAGTPASLWTIDTFYGALSFFDYGSILSYKASDSLLEKMRRYNRVELGAAARGNQATFYTGEGCVMANTQSIIGELVELLKKEQDSNCNVTGTSPEAGCAFVNDSVASFGAPFNIVGGDVFASRWDSSGIYVWFFHRSPIPHDITQNIPNPNN
ncbi:hypothetical protein BDV93DRAFT_510835 [Ceratobasidium sp. AG-I]|nr:hypothetical protein BDV93DRAFT_510835 [Ceratobasidium sp. AG-I]